MPEIRVTPLGACPSCGRVLVLPPGRGSRAPSSTDTRTGFHVLPHGESASSEGAPCPGVDTAAPQLWPRHPDVWCWLWTLRVAGRGRGRPGRGPKLHPGLHCGQECHAGLWNAHGLQ
ncbi:INTS11 isoform 35 [Pan troglodytes]|uniref:INTS11 isoform 35 n=1 Tax=Pan troglodytes TaxID=9598 RepID=A0A2J8IRR6_PANTR|nr:INTS11 isoform 35 [Pan troglodytes]